MIGSAAGRWMNARSEPVWLVVGAFGVAIAAFGVGFAPVFPLVLFSLLVMGTSDGLTIVAENGIMQRRTPDAVRSRTMAAFEAVLSIGLAVAYVLAGPVLARIGPQPVYRLGGISALLAALTLVPLLRLRDDEPAVGAAPPRYASAEALDAPTVPVGRAGAVVGLGLNGVQGSEVVRHLHGCPERRSTGMVLR